MSSSYRRSMESRDNRPMCRYGFNCYQRAPDHHNRFKHPTNNQQNQNQNRQNRDNRNAKSSRETKGDDRKVEDKKKEITERKESKESEVKESTVDSKEVKESKDSDESKDNKETDGNQEGQEVNESKESKEGKEESDSKTSTNNSNKRKSPEADESSSAEAPKAKKQNTSPETSDSKDEEKTNQADTIAYEEAKELIKEAFLFPIPDDFFKLYDFCKELKPSDPASAFKTVDLKLVGPYDVLTGLITKETVRNTELLTHWRYYYDPPEFQTVLKGNDNDGLHYGYWRDRPSSLPVFVASNCCNVSHKIKPVGENVFAAVRNLLDEKSKKANPFEKPGLFSLLGKLKIFTKKHDINIDEQTPKMKAREKLVVARTIHGAGIVVPYNKKTQVGYRELSVTDNQLLKIIKRIDDAEDDNKRSGGLSELQEIVRLATIAGDECDFGTCLELGHDLLSTGSEFVRNAALSVLSIAYNQLDRQSFLKIVEAHMKNRKKGSNVSALPNTVRQNFSLS